MPVEFSSALRIAQAVVTIYGIAHNVSRRTTATLPLDKDADITAAIGSSPSPYSRQIRPSCAGRVSRCGHSRRHHSGAVFDGKQPLAVGALGARLRRHDHVRFLPQAPTAASVLMLLSGRAITVFVGGIFLLVLLAV